LTHWSNFRMYVGRSPTRLLPNIRYGTEYYPPKVARRLRALNITTWCGAGLGTLFAFWYFIDPTPGIWKVGVTNALGSLALAMIPFFHRVGPRTAPAAFATIIYIYIFIVCWQIGTGTGMQMQYLAVAAATILFLGTEFQTRPGAFPRRPVSARADGGWRLSSMPPCLVSWTF
jgi:adenylate cyclase